MICVVPHQPVNVSCNKPTAAKCKSPIKAKETAGKATGSAESAGVKGQGLEMKFVCSQCWKDGLLSEPDRTLKYCSSKARHGCQNTRFTVFMSVSLSRRSDSSPVCLISWTKDRRILLVKCQGRKKWVTVRPLPFAKTFPQQYDVSNIRVGMFFEAVYGHIWG